MECIILHHPHQCLGVGVGLLVHDDLRHLVVAAVGGDVQRRQVVVGHVVHGHLVVQQQLDAVEVVALRRHVERRQTVLEGGGGGGGDVDGRVKSTKQKEREKRGGDGAEEETVGGTLVFDSIGAPRSSSISTTCSWPLRAPQWRGVRPSCRHKQDSYRYVGFISPPTESSMKH